ncbi:MAG: sensor histidine kinase [Deltaproteobacteria bacterium]|nr:sensor histidine kinase [Deltaproteobacteria bacterium]
MASLFLLIPAVALIVVGVLVLVFSRAVVDVTFGVLILCSCAVLLGGAVWLVVSLKRTSDLSQLQLDFLSKVSHEFKTPLTSIRMFVDTLAERRLTSEAQTARCLTLLRQETERLSALIDRLLDFGRMQAGKMVYHREPESVAAVVEAALRAFEPLREQEQVAVEIDVQPDLPPVLADREAVSGALLNLLHNACKYSGEVKRIRVECRRENGRVALSVLDNGPGVPRRERRRIFEVFYRMDDRLSRRVGGSGLGLAIVRHVAQAHGGRVRVTSRAGGGAAFSILLPVLSG